VSKSIPQIMQAVQIEDIGGPLTVGQRPVPRPGRGEVLIRMAAAPINPSDLGFMKGTYGVQMPFPVVPGFEGSGTVVAAGPGLLPRLWLGKRVACTASRTSNGTWAEYMVTPATLCVPLRKTLTLEQGAMMLVNPMTVLAFFDIAKREKHAAIVSTAAASALGRMILRLGQRNEVPVISIVRKQAQVELLHSLGGKYVLNSNNSDFSNQLRTLTHQLNATLVLDAVGGELTQRLLDAAPSGTTVLVYGRLSGERGVIEVADTLVFGNKRLAGFYLPNWLARRSFLQRLRDIQKIQHLLESALQTTLQGRFPLSSVQDALDIYQNNMSAGKVLLVANHKEVLEEPREWRPERN
jgi:NADPH2:quinone reductase